eukprot:TRINITY_DN4847_c0_g2_i8.p2 TRINITY_DN4847_c0_g2~~TRINITY_DN4847_c0_g2_i8.p2  ORF type:complete len:228 (+),score=-20.28 TRINITY_DN4847_c0_g2_i8:479-1162(+)
MVRWNFIGFQVYCKIQVNYLKILFKKSQLLFQQLIILQYTIFIQYKQIYYSNYQYNWNQKQLQMINKLLFRQLIQKQIHQINILQTIILQYFNIIYYIYLYQKSLQQFSIINIIGKNINQLQIIVIHFVIILLELKLIANNKQINYCIKILQYTILNKYNVPIFIQLEIQQIYYKFFFFFFFFNCIALNLQHAEQIYHLLPTTKYFSQQSTLCIIMPSKQIYFHHSY